MPLLEELLMLSLRAREHVGRKDGGSEDYKHKPLVKAHFQSMVGAMFVFTKRFCLSVMRNQSLALLAIVISGVEEALER